MSFNSVAEDRLLANTGRLCCICNNRHRVQLHHIIPLENGGSDDIDNAIPLCPNCHDEVHTGYISGRVTKKYTPAELKLHRQRTIETVKSFAIRRDISASQSTTNVFLKAVTDSQTLRNQLKAEVEQNLALLRQYKGRLFKQLPNSGQASVTFIYNFADLDLPNWPRTVWQAYSSTATDTLNSSEFERVLALYSQLDSICIIRSAYQQYKIKVEEIPAKKADLIRRGMFNSSLWNGLIEYERNVTHSKNLVWMELIEIFKKTLDLGNPIN